MQPKIKLGKKLTKSTTLGTLPPGFGASAFYYGDYDNASHNASGELNRYLGILHVLL